MFSKLMLLVVLVFNAQITSAKELIIISDLDETTRQASIEHLGQASVKLIEGVKPYQGIRAIYQEIAAKNPQAKFYYLSNSYPFLYKGDKWSQRNGFPEGVVYQRSTKDKKESFKPRKLKEIVANHPDASFLLFGDNIELDPTFYRELVADTQIDAKIFIRDARLIFPSLGDITYYQTEAQITDDLNMSDETTATVRSLPFNELVPKFLLKNLKRRLIKSCSSKLEDCCESADRKVQDVIDELSLN